MVIKFNLKDYIEQHFNKEYYPLQNNIEQSIYEEKYEKTIVLIKKQKYLENVYINKAIHFGQNIIDNVYNNILGYENPIKGLK